MRGSLSHRPTRRTTRSVAVTCVVFAVAHVACSSPSEAREDAVGVYAATSVNGRSLPATLTASSVGGRVVLNSDTLVLSPHGFVETLRLEGPDGSRSAVVFQGNWWVEGTQVRLQSLDGLYEHTLARDGSSLVTVGRRIQPGTDELIVLAFGRVP